jgi:hypothetical protein
MTKFVDQARRMPGIFIDTGTELYPVRSITSAPNGIGVRGDSTSGRGVRGSSTSGIGVEGVSTSDYGVYGVSTSNIGVYGYSIDGWGMYAASSSSYAGYFAGDIYVSGSCTGCAGPTMIDHPLDPERKYLYHSTVQSPDMLNIYRGTVALDSKGEATVKMPDWFEPLNRDFDYQLTAIGAPGPNLHISRKVKNNRFSIAGGTAGMEVSWQVTGIRQDLYANAHRIPVEEDKPADEQGKYLHPTEWGQPESLGVNYKQHRMQEPMKP